jgi:hypothetical protein
MLVPQARSESEEKSRGTHLDNGLLLLCGVCVTEVRETTNTTKQEESVGKGLQRPKKIAYLV